MSETSLTHDAFTAVLVIAPLAGIAIDKMEPIAAITLYTAIIAYEVATDESDK